MSDCVREMTEIERNEYLINNIKNVSCPVLLYQWEKDLTISALEKQIPKKPIAIKCDESITYRCVCGRFQKQVYFDKAGTVHGHEAKYCEYCGQAIDWSESDE